MNKLIIDGKTQTFNVEEEDFITENNIKFFKKLRFYLNGAFVEIDNPDPDITLLEYVRSIGLTG